MIQIIAKPVKAPVVNKEGLYSMLIKLGTGGYRKLLDVRARNGTHAEEKLAFCFLHELKDKTLDFDLEKFAGKEA